MSSRRKKINFCLVFCVILINLKVFPSNVMDYSSSDVLSEHSCCSNLLEERSNCSQTQEDSGNHADIADIPMSSPQLLEVSICESSVSIVSKETNRTFCERSNNSSIIGSGANTRSFVASEGIANIAILPETGNQVHTFSDAVSEPVLLPTNEVNNASEHSSESGRSENMDRVLSPDTDPQKLYPGSTHTTNDVIHAFASVFNNFNVPKTGQETVLKLCATILPPDNNLPSTKYLFRKETPHLFDGYEKKCDQDGNILIEFDVLKQIDTIYQGTYFIKRVILYV